MEKIGQREAKMKTEAPITKLLKRSRNACMVIVMKRVRSGQIQDILSR